MDRNIGLGRIKDFLNLIRACSKDVRVLGNGIHDAQQLCYIARLDKERI